MTRMPPKVDIIVPHYKEEWEIGEKLFTIMNLQRGVDFRDFRVTVVNDGGNRIPEERFAGLKYEVRQIDIPHRGVSAARNAGVDAAEAEWIMFCDFDDMFAGIYALRDIMTVLPAENYDLLWAKMIAEDFTGGRETIYFTPEKQTFVFTHGKLYRLSWLRENGVRFDETLNFQEDSLFNAVIIARMPYRRIGEIKTRMPMYIWIRRENSVTNSGREDEAVFSTFIRNLKTTEENRLHRDYNSYCGMVTRTVWDTYHMIRGTRASAQIKRKILDIFVPWITERLDAFGVDDDIMRQIREISREEFCDNDQTPDDPMTVRDWLHMTIKG